MGISCSRLSLAAAHSVVKIARKVRSKIMTTFQQVISRDGIRADINNRTGHIALAHDDHVLIWGGYYEEFGTHKYWSPDIVTIYDPITQSVVVRRKTYGDVPLPCCAPAAEIVDGHLYLLLGFIRVIEPEFEIPGMEMPEMNTNGVHVLNLTTWMWTKLEPEGKMPFKCDKTTSWVYERRIFVFGGFGPIWNEGRHPMESQPEGVTYITDDGDRGWNNQLVIYNIDQNSWEWPKCTGSAPSPRAAHASFVCGSKAFVFGGRLQNLRMNDLYCLDLTTFKWNLIQPHIPITAAIPDVPMGRSWHSLTLFDAEKRLALLYGGYNTSNVPLEDCWILNFGCDSSSGVRWTRRQDLEKGRRLWHASAYDKEIGEVIVVGGVVNNLLAERARHPTNELCLRVRPASLVRISARAVINQMGRRQINPDDISALPKCLKDLVEGQSFKVSTQIQTK